MGRMLITYDDLNSYLNNKYNIYSEEQRFLNDFFNIGFTTHSSEILNLNIERNPQIDFEYDDLVKMDRDKLNKNYKKFLKINEQVDDVLFHIAENYYEIFMKFKSRYISTFDLIKSSFVKMPNFDDLITKIELKINYFEEMLNRVKYSHEEKNLIKRDLSSSLKGIQFNNNFKLFDDISNDILNFEDMNERYFNRDKFETIKFFETAIINLEKIRDKLIFKGQSERYQDKINLNENMNFQMSSSAMAPAKFDSSGEIPSIESIKNFNRLSETILDEIKFYVHSDIYLNFLAIDRINEHYKDISNLQNTLGKILKS